MDLLRGLKAFFDAVPCGRGDRLVVAFSGGGDSTALLWGLTRLAPRWGTYLVAAHLDHAMDPDSGARARHAGGLARKLGVPLIGARREVPRQRGAAESLEAAARRLRYEFLEEVRRGCRARYVATAHHRDDQAETVLLRLSFGSGLRGLAAIQPVNGAVVRPLLTLPRASLRAAVAAAGLRPAEDAGNADPSQPRSRMRHRSLPALARSEAARVHELVEALARLAARAQRALPVLDRRLAAEIGLSVLPAEASAGLGPGSVGGFGELDECAALAVDRRRLAALPAPLLPHALALLHRLAGAPHPPSQAAIGELQRQLRSAAGAGRGSSAPPLPSEGPRVWCKSAVSHANGGRVRRRRAPRAVRVACDCGDGWCWLGTEGRLEVRRNRVGETAPSFTYTLEVPGEVAIPELAVTIRVSEAPFEAWMLRGAAQRAGLALPLSVEGAAGLVTVRNRRAGDRLRPLGSPGSRKLKDLLIDRGVPRSQRDRVPLLCWAGEIAWVPGVTIDHRFRLTAQSSVCLAEVIS